MTESDNSNDTPSLSALQARASITPVGAPPKKQVPVEATNAVKANRSEPRIDETPAAEATASEVPAAAPKLPAEWSELGLSEAALELIRKAGFKNPTPVQAESIPLAMKGGDLIASAQTGTGKTASFVLPMVERFAGREGTFGLILAPTREIAQQTQATLDLFGTPRGVRSIVLIGGIDMKIDEKAIAGYPQIIVATPGRLCDHLDRGNIWLDFIQMVVLDEADRMLDMGFSDQLARVMQDVPEDSQRLIYSATFPPSVDRLTQKFMNNPTRVAIGKPTTPAAGVEQRAIRLSEESKMSELTRLIRKEPGTIIVFTRSKIGASKVWRSLHSRGVYDATYIHSDCTQSHREQALADFKAGKYRILVATDVAGRGIHVDNVAHVINYDLPMEPEDYIHRIGRSGRQGASGKSTTFVTHRDRETMRRIVKLVGRDIPGLEDGGADSEHSSDSRGGHRPPRGTSQQNRGPGPRAHKASGNGAVQASGSARPASSSAGPAQGSSDGQSNGRPSGRRRRRGGRGGRGGGGGGGGAGGGNTAT